jgi:hypothetical protein
MNVRARKVLVEIIVQRCAVVLVVSTDLACMPLVQSDWDLLGQ